MTVTGTTCEISRVRVLGVIVNNKLTATDHVTMLLILYAMRLLRSHGTPTTSLHDMPSDSRFASPVRGISLVRDEFRYRSHMV